MKKLIIILIGICVCNLVKAQDIITKTNGEEIKAKVLEVTQTEIKYKNTDNLNGPSYTINKADVLTIKYQNGTKDIINPNTPENNTAAKSKETTPKKSTASSDPRNTLSVSYGWSLPNGDYGSNNLNSSEAGLATGGHILNLYYSYRIGDNMGLSALIQSQANKVDAQHLANALAGLDPTYSWSVSSDSWSMGSFMVGGFGSYPMDASGSSYFDSRLMIGYLSASSPALSTYGSNGYTSISQNVYSVTGGSFCYLIGVGFHFNVSSKISILANADYFGAKPEFENVETYTYSSNGYYSDDFTTYKQPISSINIGLGIGFGF